MEALATFEAYDDLAKLQSLAQISSHIGRDIREEDVTEAMAQLEAALEPPLPSDEVATGIQYNVSSEVSYDTEDLGVVELSHLSSLKMVNPDYGSASAATLRVPEVDEVTGEDAALLLEQHCLGVQEDLLDLGLLGSRRRPTADELTRDDPTLDAVYGSENWQADAENSTRFWDDVIEPNEAAPDADVLDDEALTSLFDIAEEVAFQVRLELGDVAGGGAAAHTEMDCDDDCVVEAGLELLSSLDAKQLVVKLIASNRRRAQRQARASERYAEARRALASGLASDSGTAPCLTSVLRLYPDIGDKVEAICADIGIGADAHRQDASLTLNAATKRTKGSGYTRIQLELASRHGIHLNRRTVQRIGLCRRSRSLVAANYMGLVAMKYRRSVKRVATESLDMRASRASHRTLHYVRDECSQDDVSWLERDNASAIRRRFLP